MIINDYSEFDYFLGVVIAHKTELIVLDCFFEDYEYVFINLN